MASWVIWRLEGSLSAIILGKHTCLLCHVIPRSQLRCVLYDLNSTVFIPGYTAHNKPLKVPNKCEIACDVFSPSLFTLCALITQSHDRSISPLFISCRNWLSLIGATRNISKQETGCSPNSIHKATSKSVWPNGHLAAFCFSTYTNIFTML